MWNIQTVLLSRSYNTASGKPAFVNFLLLINHHHQGNVLGRVYLSFSSKGLGTVVEGTTYQQAADMEAGTRASDWWFTSQATNRKERGSGDGVSPWNFKAHSEWHSSSSKTILSKPPQMVPPTRDQVFKCQDPIGILSMTIKSVIILRAKNEFSRQILFCIELLFQLVEIKLKWQLIDQLEN